MNNAKNKLKEFGLNEKEIEIYLYLLKDNDTPAYKIATETGIPRTTVYKILESLEKQGIISKWSKNSVKHFSAENPKKLADLLEEKRKALEEVLPDLIHDFNNRAYSPKTKLYKGKEGIKYSFKQILEKAEREDIKKMYVISDNKLTEILPNFFLNWRKIKNQRTDSFTYLIVPKGISSENKYASDENRETREMNTQSSFDSSINIVGDNVFFFSFNETNIYSISIESDVVAAILTKLFLYIWDSLK
jgi:sugar-specific transcriptional regulator TrmB